MGLPTEQFYAQMPAQSMELSQLVGQKQRFAAVPQDWQIILTDIKRSTQAVQAGSQEVVNLIASGSIIAALNIAYAHKTVIPFFFGGDGATLLVPPSLREPILAALRVHRENTYRNYQLELRVGEVPMAQVYAAGHTVALAKAQLNPIFSIPVVLGAGLDFAEGLVKGQEDPPHEDQPDAYLLNLEGMECRWDRINPPQPTQEVLCLLVVAREESRQTEVYSQVLAAMDEIYGSPQTRKPISTQRLQLKPTLEKLQTEMRVRLGRFDPFYLLKNWLITAFGPFYIRYIPKGRNYLNMLVELSDTLVLDGRINTVMSGAPEQRLQLTQQLDAWEAVGDLWYGLYVSSESIMSCYVRGRDDEHIHFIDGSGGGYTQAARMLKQKLGK